MSTILRSLCVLLMSVVPALAAADADPEGSGILVALFLGFGALIIVFQFIPSIILFGSMLKGLFSAPAKETALSTTEKGK